MPIIYDPTYWMKKADYDKAKIPLVAFLTETNPAFITQDIVVREETPFLTHIAPSLLGSEKWKDYPVFDVVESTNAANREAESTQIEKNVLKLERESVPETPPPVTAPTGDHGGEEPPDGGAAQVSKPHPSHPFVSEKVEMPEFETIPETSEVKL